MTCVERQKKHRRRNFLAIGSTRSGKTYGEVYNVLNAAEDGDVAIVVVDPHPQSLAAMCFEHLVARGHASRILYDQVTNLDVVLSYRFLHRSRAENEWKRRSEDEQTVREFIDVLLRRRQQDSLAGSPLTEQYTVAAGKLLISQTKPRNESDMAYAFRPGHAVLTELIAGCTDSDVQSTFADINAGKIKSGQYASAKRLIDAVCLSPAFQIRCGGRLNLDRFLDRHGILLVEGGTQGVSEDVMRTILGSVILQTINFVRSRPRPWPVVLLVMDEAINAALIGSTGHEARALAELQKAGLDMHILVQSLNFGSPFVTDAVLSNCTRHAWYYNANDEVARKAAQDLGNPEFREQVRLLRTGERIVKDHNQVFREVVPVLPDLWSFPGLGEVKAKEALQVIQQRPEYVKVSSCREHEPTSSATETAATKKSANKPTATSASRTTSSTFSPAQRLATGGSPSSAKNESSAASESSS